MIYPHLYFRLTMVFDLVVIFIPETSGKKPASINTINIIIILFFFIMSSPKFTNKTKIIPSTNLILMEYF